MSDNIFKDKLAETKFSPTDIKLAIIDADNEYLNLAKSLGAEIIHIKPSKVGYFNPLEIHAKEVSKEKVIEMACVLIDIIPMSVSQCIEQICEINKLNYSAKDIKEMVDMVNLKLSQ